MICKNCPEGRRYAAGSIYCILYGIYIRENHECIREGGKRHDGDADNGRGSQDRTEIQDNSTGAAGGLPGVVQKPGERTSVFGLDEEWPE